jgi:hypothetical protein
MTGRGNDEPGEDQPTAVNERATPRQHTVPCQDSSHGL